MELKRVVWSIAALALGAGAAVAVSLPSTDTGAVMATGEAVEDVVLPAVVATEDATVEPEIFVEPTPEPVETPAPAPAAPAPAPAPAEEMPETIADCREILAAEDDGSETWTECYVWFVETSETPEEQAEAQEILTRDVEPEPERVEEDDPRWDCRTMGNFQCGVQIQGEWYVVTFEDGEPAGVAKQ